MIFLKNKKLNNSEIRFVKEFLEGLINKSKEVCQKSAEENGFLYLDEWDKKMGFLKEIDNKYMILVLRFKDQECSFYQLITKRTGETWLDSRTLDYNTVRENGIVTDDTELNK